MQKSVQKLLKQGFYVNTNLSSPDISMSNMKSRYSRIFTIPVFPALYANSSAELPSFIFAFTSMFSAFRSSTIIFWLFLVTANIRAVNPLLVLALTSMSSPLFNKLCTRGVDSLATARIKAVSPWISFALTSVSSMSKSAST